METLQQEFQRSHSMELRVYYEDTDFSGFVYHANYLKWFERSREELLGVNNIQTFFAQQLHFVVGEAHLRYLAPARHADLVRVETNCTFSRSPQVLFHQIAKRGDQILVEANIHVVAVNQDGRPQRLPKWALSILREQAAEK